MLSIPSKRPKSRLKTKSITTIAIAFWAGRYRSMNIVSVLADSGCAMIVSG